MHANHRFQDPVLDAITQQVPYPVIQSTKDVFHDLMSCILEQQIHYRSTKKITAKALERAGIEKMTPHNFHLLEQYAFPHLKLAESKYKTMQLVMDYWSHSPPDFTKLTDEQVRAELSKIKGIGPWTLDMILLYTLERPNIFPVDDFHLKQIMVLLYQLNPHQQLKAQMQRIANGWGSHRSLAVLYLLAWKQLKQ